MQTAVLPPKTNHLLLALAATTLLSGCDALLGKEVARLPIDAVSTPGHRVEKTVKLQLRANDKVALWSDLDIAYRGAAPLRFQVAVLKDGQPFQQLELDPTEKNVTVNEVKTSVNDKVSWRFTGKNAELPIAEAGTYTFTGRLVAAPNATLQVNKAELVLKQ